MPLIYADTSVLFAHFHPDDELSRVVDSAVQQDTPDFIYWSFLKFELRHNLRQANTDNNGTAAWRALRAAENTRTRLRWQDLNTDKLIENADHLSLQHSKGNGAGAADWLHVAAALKISFLAGFDEFWTGDKEQAAAATLAGLTTRLFKP
jgi:predicted nucleic acid-binding protein